MAAPTGRRGRPAGLPAQQIMNWSLNGPAPYVHRSLSEGHLRERHHRWSGSQVPLSMTVSWPSCSGTGRGAGREALAHLAQEGPIDQELHRGAHVRSLGDDDVRDIYAARQRSRHMLRSAGSTMSRSAIFPRARGDVEQDQNLVTGSGRPSDRPIEAHVHLNRQIADLAGSRRLGGAFGTLASDLRMVLHLYPAEFLSVDRRRSGRPRIR